MATTEVLLEELEVDTGEDAYGMLYHLDESVLQAPASTNRIARQLGS